MSIATDTVPLWVRWLVTLGIVAIIVVLSTVPGQARAGDSIFLWFIATTPPLVQKLMHFVGYGGLALAWVWALDGVMRPWLRLAVAFLLTVSIGAILEWYQLQVPGRYGNIMDLLLNAAGAVAGLAAALFIL